MSKCACARSRSFCEIRGCLSHPEYGYYRPTNDGDPVRLPWSPRYVGVLADHRAKPADRKMVIHDTLMNRAASVPGPPEKVVPTIFEFNRDARGGFRFVHWWDAADSYELTFEDTIRAMGGEVLR